jgi:signal transduction histidine kinase
MAEILVILLMQYRTDSIAFIFLYIIAVDVFLDLKLKHALFMAVLLIAAFLVSTFEILGRDSLSLMLSNFAVLVFIMIFFSTAARSIRRELNRRMEMQSLYEENRKAKEELEEANRKLTEYAERVEDIAVLNERNRLAGEIHDTIGHSLTALIMEIDIANKLIDRDVEKTKDELKKAAVLARSTLAEVRKSVRAMKPENIEDMMGIKAVQELIREFEKATKILVKFNVSKNRYMLSPSIDVTIYRTIQEALTNCAKHGHADRVSVDLSFKEGYIELSIKDNGTGCREFTKGVGTRTMEERVRTLGGTVDFKGDDGFMINLVIPVEVA